MWRLYNAFKQNLRPRLARLYGDENVDRLLERLSLIAGRYSYLERRCSLEEPCWDERTCLLITYGDMVRSDAEQPLATLHRFLVDHLQGVVTAVHLLPFFPFSSDDGFAVVDFRQVDPALGDWQLIEAMNQDFRLMFDLVLNHVSSQSRWFQDYLGGIAPARNYFIEIEPGTDLSAVVRPRALPLLTPVRTVHGEQLVWTTFSADQVDLNFSNPDVLLEMLDIFLGYVNQGAGIIRMDAIAFLWKEVGTPCINLPQTHEIVKLFRDVIEHLTPGTLLLTETNLPHAENVSYFGNGDEAHMVYQFSLPPLLLHAVQNGTAAHLSHWADGLAPPPPGCTFLNFTASHDGIGVRPLEGLVEPGEIAALAEAVQRCGGHVSTRSTAAGEVPYELNITWFDAMQDPHRPGDIDWQIQRFLCTQAVMLSLRGIPAIYFHSLTGSRNNHGGVELTGMYRTINRGRWQDRELRKLLADGRHPTAAVFAKYREMLLRRAGYRAFHPDSLQRIVHIGDALFALERLPKDGPVVTCIHNLSPEPQEVDLGRLGSAGIAGGATDILSGKKTGAQLRLEPFRYFWLTGGGADR